MARHHGARRTHDEAHSLVDWVSGACLLIRRKELDEVGGFDPRFFMYAEDVDLCAAVRARGRSVLFSAEPQVVHLRGNRRRQRRKGCSRLTVAASLPSTRSIIGHGPFLRITSG